MIMIEPHSVHQYENNAHLKTGVENAEAEADEIRLGEPGPGESGGRLDVIPR